MNLQNSVSPFVYALTRGGNTEMTSFWQEVCAEYSDLVLSLDANVLYHIK